jgi:hypothetical protein
MLLVGLWFLCTGFGTVALGDARALAPITMAGAFSVGMALVAGIHRFSAQNRSVDKDKEA